MVEPASARMISVVIPAHNEQEYIGRTLAALHRQNYRWFEIIVVANGCTDRTADMAVGKCHQLVVLSQKNLGVARNLGARLAKGELLLFLDADTTLEPMALREIAREFSPDDAAGTLRGRPDRIRLKYNLLYALKNLVHRLSLHPGSSGVMLCWKDTFMKVGGFDEDLEMRENSHLMTRLKRFGRYRYIGAVGATTSMRRYEQRGFRRVVWMWTKIWFRSLVCDLRNRTYEAIR